MAHGLDHCYPSTEFPAPDFQTDPTPTSASSLRMNQFMSWIKKSLFHSVNLCVCLSVFKKKSHLIKNSILYFFPVTVENNISIIIKPVLHCIYSPSRCCNSAYLCISSLIFLKSYKEDHSKRMSSEKVKLRKSKSVTKGHTGRSSGRSVQSQTVLPRALTLFPTYWTAANDSSGCSKA